jgi:hypothetical protein
MEPGGAGCGVPRGAWRTRRTRGLTGRCRGGVERRRRWGECVRGRIRWTGGGGGGGTCRLALRVSRVGAGAAAHRPRVRSARAVESGTLSRLRDPTSRPTGRRLNSALPPLPPCAVARQRCHRGMGPVVYGAAPGRGCLVGRCRLIRSGLRGGRRHCAVRALLLGQLRGCRVRALRPQRQAAVLHGRPTGGQWATGGRGVARLRSQPQSPPPRPPGFGAHVPRSGSAASWLRARCHGA